MRSFIRSYFVFRIRIRRINRPELSPWNVTPHLHHPFFGICMEKIFIFTRNSYSGVATPHIYFWLFFVLLCFVNSTHTHICIKLQKKKKGGADGEFSLLLLFEAFPWFTFHLFSLQPVWLCALHNLIHFIIENIFYYKWAGPDR